jgi:hypothetical protein
VTAHWSMTLYQPPTSNAPQPTASTTRPRPPLPHLTALLTMASDLGSTTTSTARWTESCVSVPATTAETDALLAYRPLNASNRSKDIVLRERIRELLHEQDVLNEVYEK